MQLVIWLAFLLTAHAQTERFYITLPFAGTRWKAGDAVSITWDILAGPTELRGINVDLMDGPDENADLLRNIAANLPPDSTSYSWKIPELIANSDRVFVRLTGIGEEAAYSFSHRFSIHGGQPPASSVSLFTQFRGYIPTSLDQIATQITSFPPAVSLIDPNEIEKSTSKEATSTITAPTNIVRQRSNNAPALMHCNGLLIALLGWIVIL